jgi:hypothetical protein
MTKEKPLHSLVEAYTKADSEVTKMEEMLRAAEDELSLKKQTIKALVSDDANLNDLLKKRHDPEIRFQLRSEIREKIQKVEVFPGGWFMLREIWDEIVLPNWDKPEVLVKLLSEQPFVPYHLKHLPPSILSWRKQPQKWDDRFLWSDTASKRLRYFIVHFKNGVKKMVTPEDQLETGTGREITVTKNGSVLDSWNMDQWVRGTT